MSFDFAVETTEVSTTTTDDTEETPEFVSSEVPEIYLSLGDWKTLLGEMLEALDFEALKIYSDDTLEDASRLLGEYSEAHPMQQLHMVASLAKSTAGKMQRDTDHGIGLSDGKAPESHYEESFSYALYYSDLPSINWDDLDGGERENLEEMGIDPSEVGFDTTYGGPKLLVIDSQRLPIAVEEGNEVTEALETLQQVPDEPSHWAEEGFVESSHPEVFGEETDKVAGEENKEYDVCDKHGHDLRDYEYSGLESKLNQVVQRYNITYGIITEAVPGHLIGVQHLIREKTAVCRDCDHEDTKRETIETRIVFRNDGEIKTISFAHYKSLLGEYEKEQE